MGPRVGLDRQKFSSPRDSNPDRPARISVAIPTELPCPHICYIIYIFLYTHSVYFYSRILGRVRKKFLKIETCSNAGVLIVVDYILCCDGIKLFYCDS